MVAETSSMETGSGQAAQTTTDSDSPISNGESESASEAPQGPETGPESSNLQSQLLTVRNWLWRQWTAGRIYWIPPALLTEPPPTVSDLANYARHGTWTTGDGFVRRVGVIWHLTVSLPVTAVCRYTEWVLQRPGRFLPIFALWKLLILTGGGPWTSTHLIRPLLGLLAWIMF